jgi:hypothetical protein
MRLTVFMSVSTSEELLNACSRRATLRRDKCNMTPESRKTAVDGQRLCKHIPAATNTHATTEELLEVTFSMRHMSYQILIYSERKISN